MGNLIKKNKQELGVTHWEEIDSTPPGRLQGFRWSRVRLMLRFARSVWQALAPCDPKDEPRVLHVHTGGFYSFFEKAFFVALGRVRGAGTMLHVHGAGFDRFCMSAGPILQSIIALLLRMPDRVIVLSPYWAQVVRRVLPSIGAKQICVLPNGVHVPDPSISRRDDSEDPFRVIFIGCVGDRKGCGEILEAAARLADFQDVQFHLFGGGDFEGDLRRYRGRAASRRLTNVHFLGHTTGRDKARMLRRADLFVLPSRGENLPIALLEAMAYGLPVVVTRVGAMPEVVGPENGVVIAPRDAEGLAQAIKHMYERPEERSAMGARNARRVREQYGAGRFIARLRAIYASLTG